MLTIIKDKRTYHVRLKRMKGGKGYILAGIFLNHDKIPMTGTTFPTNSNPSDILQWAETNINSKKILTR